MVVHGSTVAMAGRAVLILGASGSGKSSLALALMATGADLVADDRTLLQREGASVMADAPAALRGCIEARHVGLLAADAKGPLPVALVVELSDESGPRLPEEERIEVLGVSLPRLAARFDPRLAPALRQLLIGGRVA